MSPPKRKINLITMITKTIFLALGFFTNLEEDKV